MVYRGRRICGGERRWHHGRFASRPSVDGGCFDSYEEGVKRIEQAILGPIYALAVALRRVVWGIRRPVAVGVRTLIVRDGAVLLVRHRAGRAPWGLPGGGVDRYE